MALLAKQLSKDWVTIKWTQLGQKSYSAGAY